MTRENFWVYSLKDLKAPKVGKKTQEALDKAGLLTIRDLLLFIPLRYKKKILIDLLDQRHADQTEVYLEGRILEEIRPTSAHKKIFKALLETDRRQQIELVFFQNPQWIAHNLQLGKRIRVFGKIQKNQGMAWQIVHPETESVIRHQSYVPHIDPVYRKNQGVSQSVIRTLLDIIFQKSIEEKLLREELFESFKVVHLYQPTLNLIEHFDHRFEKALSVLSQWEGIAYFRQYVFRQKFWQQGQAPVLKSGRFSDLLLRNFQHQLTSQQERLWHSLQQSFASSKPSQLFIQGDVGSGKTILAFLSMMMAAEQGIQSVLMAPTEILALQHHAKLNTLIGKEISPLLLSGSMTAAQKREALEKIASGEVLIVIGTQAVFQEAVHFHALGLVIIDEQHRFGIEQRTKLLQKSSFRPHYLTLTATPIPRTLALALSGMSHYEVLSEKPQNRKEILTYTVPYHKKHLVISSVAKALSKGHAVYWVCPFIEDSDHVQGQSAVRAFEMLSQEPLLAPYAKGLIHGKMGSLERTDILKSFYQKTIPLLVSTLVVEVGIDHPDATLIVIESPERLGLAQLHQLRGRVGRGSEQSYCLLLYPDDLTEQSVQRLQALCQHHDGLQLAEVDLDLRGPGSFLGQRQSGFDKFTFFDIKKSKPLMPAIAHELTHGQEQEHHALSMLFGFELNEAYCD